MKEKKSALSQADLQPACCSTSTSVAPLLVCIFAIYTSLLLAISNKINEVQPIPYLDEIYHVPQAKEYCRGNYSYWDNRITTLPGLYIFSVAFLTPLSKFLDQNMCETQHLRFINIGISLCSLILYILLIRKIHQDSKGANLWKVLWSAFNVACFPPLFFFSFLYYTDVAAAFFVFLMYCLHVHGYSVFAAITGVMAILARQTSIVWVILVAADSFVKEAQNYLLSAKERKGNASSQWRQVQVILKKFFQLNTLSLQFQCVCKLVLKVLPYILVGLGFLAFVVINDGLVVGDRNAHTATIHFPQLFYLFGLVTLFAAPHWTDHLLSFYHACRKKWFFVLMCAGLVALVIRYNTLVHPYLLADNRHYTFYIWKRVFEYRPWGRYALIPLYLFGAYATYQTMSKTKNFLFALVFIGCSMIALVPQRLLEIRYFFIPYLFIRLHIEPRSWASLFIEFIMYAVLNTATIYLFVTRPFFWPDSDLVQRFMW